MSGRDFKPAVIRSWASERLSDEVQRVLHRLSRTDDVRHIAVMPDVHLAKSVCVGTAFATTELLYPDAIGGDIGCGVAALALSGDVDTVSEQRTARRLLSAIAREVPIRRHRSEDVRDLNRELLPDAAGLSTPALQRAAKRDGLVQLGTLGTGNHFLEIQRDEDGRLWLTVHSGSRGMGQAIRASHVPRDVSSHSLFAIDASTPAGEAYLHDMAWAREYAAANRRSMLLAAGMAIRNVLGIKLMPDTFFESDHNHINLEPHFGRRMFIHRKGAMPAALDEPGIVPGSMAAATFHVLGRGCDDALRSSAHGAGRAMSRGEALRRVTEESFRRQLFQVVVNERLMRRMRDEAPASYKDVHKVLRAQRRLVRIVRTLTPILTHKGVGRAT